MRNTVLMEGLFLQERTFAQNKLLFNIFLRMGACLAEPRGLSSLRQYRLLAFRRVVRVVGIHRRVSPFLRELPLQVRAVLEVSLCVS